MSNNNLLSSMEFEKRITEMSDRELIEFSAREAYKASIASRKMQDEVYGKDGEPGIKARLNNTERKQIDNRKFIYAMWALDVAIISALIGLFITHLAL